jgi:exodeoxyribonuclease-3
MKIISWNVNGIRAIEKKGELDIMLAEQDPDILLLQETKASWDQLSEHLTEHADYAQFYHSAEKKGYSGVGIWIKRTIAADAAFSTGMPGFEDKEGRIGRIDLGDTIIFGIYFPNGGKSEAAWNDKLVFYEKFLEHVNDLRNEGRRVIWAGDVNCAHEEIDLARPKNNKKSIGFLPEERAWVSKVIENGWVDVYRHNNPETVIYSWWHMRSGARARNVGWRIDYFFVDLENLRNVVEMAYLNDQLGSDHCPVVLDIN